MSQTTEIALHSYTLTSDEFSSIPEDQRAALGLVSFAMSEINTLAKAYLFFQHKMTGDEIIDVAITLQNGTLLRNWSATILDFLLLFTDTKKNKSQDVELKKLFKESADLFLPLKEQSTYKLVKIMRNEVTNHFFLEPAKLNLSFVSENADLSLNFHKMQGNNFAPLGGEIMFIGRGNKFGANLTEKSDILQLHKDWMDWNLAAWRWSIRVFDLFVKRLLTERFPNKKLVTTTHTIPSNLVGYAETFRAPIFLKTDADL